MPAPSPIDAFSSHFGKEPTWRITAPGRINLIGEHVDYLGGFVMPVAIDRALRLAVRANDSGKIRLWTSGQTAEVDLSKLVPFTGELFWLSYVTGVVEMLRREGIEPRGFDVAITSDLPTGAGLSSSAALETGIALAMEAVTGQALDPVTRARLCQQAEHEFAGVPCGLMDQLAVGLGKRGHALMIDCQDHSLEWIEIPHRLMIVVADTGVKHALADGEYRRRREECEAALERMGKDHWREVLPEDLDWLDGKLLQRARHVVTEMARVPQMRAAMAEEDLKRIGQILRAGHHSLRDDFEVSCRELDVLVEAVDGFGAIGARMTGGGFGGSTISLIREQEEMDAIDLISHLKRLYELECGRELNAFVVRASDGATTQKL